MIERGTQLLGIEVKSKTRPQLSDVPGLRLFLEEYAPEAQGGLVVHDGTDTYYLTKNILAVP